MTQVSTINDLLTLDEGKRAKVYLDTKGIPSIGVGRNLRDRGLSDDEIAFLLANDVHDCTRDCMKWAWFPSIAPARQLVLISMRFIFGVGFPLNWPNFISQCGKGDWEGAARNIEHTLFHAQAPSRVERFAKMLRTGEFLDRSEW